MTEKDYEKLNTFP